MERGIVRVRVGLSYDPLRLSPCSGDLYNRKLRGQKCHAPPTNQPPTLHNNHAITTRITPSKPQQTKFIILSILSRCRCSSFSVSLQVQIYIKSVFR